MTLSWTQPTCEACWIDQATIWDEVTGLTRVGIKMPVKVNEPEPEQCSYCGAMTVVGIYTRADPATVPYPKEKE